MDGNDILVVIAELALGLAGFSGIVAVFHQGKAQLDRVEINRLGVLLSVALSAMLLALLPFIVFFFGIYEEALWRICSAAMALLSIFIIGNYLRAVWLFRAQAPEVVGQVAFIFVLISHTVNLAVQVLSATGALVPAMGYFLAGLIWYLIHCSYQFSRILFIRPAKA